eukprot:NODE_216_length_12483_cov_2.137516.p5 type:complete len:376 gc:universal NODE_216_length_12483_cov_2.137516:9440-8313(-)
MDLNNLRETIDVVDQRIIQLLNERAQVSLRIGAAKKQINNDSDAPVYYPAREQQIFEKLAKLNSGPMLTENLIAIYREIMSASINMQRDTTIACLGPIGTFSHTAAKGRFGDSVTYLPLPSIRDVFKAVETNQATYGLIPFENSYKGSVQESLDCFPDHNIYVIGETSIEIHHSIVSVSPDANRILKVYSHPEALQQCGQWLSQNLPNAQRCPVSSTAHGAELASRDPNSAAICHESLAEKYKLQIVAKDIEEHASNYPNTTRFFIIQPKKDLKTLLASLSTTPKENLKSLIMFTVDHRKPGALVDALGFFKENGLNLTKIDSRPSGKVPWHYWFFVECHGNVFEILELTRQTELATFCLDLHYLGAYPKDQKNK